MLEGNERQRLLAALSEKTRGYVGEEAVDAAMRLISELTIIGPAIIHTLHDMRTKRLLERTVELFERMDRDLRAVEEEKINREFFKTEEFQTVVFLALQQLQTTHDPAKLHALADSLANSALVKFSAESRKELFFRIFRDLAPEDFQTLQKLMPQASLLKANHNCWPEIDEPSGDSLANLQRLEAQGLVNVSLQSEMKLSSPRYGITWTPSDAERAIRKAFETPPSRHFRISELGLEFLTFFAEFQYEIKQ